MSVRYLYAMEHGTTNGGNMNPRYTTAFVGARGRMQHVVVDNRNGVRVTSVCVSPRQASEQARRMNISTAR